MSKNVLVKYMCGCPNGASAPFNVAATAPAGNAWINETLLSHLTTNGMLSSRESVANLRRHFPNLVTFEPDPKIENKILLKYKIFQNLSWFCSSAKRGKERGKREEKNKIKNNLFVPCMRQAREWASFYMSIRRFFKKISQQMSENLKKVWRALLLS